MKLPKRLGLIASFVKKGSVVYDIGCDHALLDIFLTLYNENECYACDKIENALHFARKNIKKYNLEDKIEVICSDGLKNIEVKENSIAVISGMGTSTILEILNNEQISKFSYLLVAPHNDYKIFRKATSKLGLKITEEMVLFENKIYYLIFKLEHGNAKYSKKDLEFGPILRKNNDLETLSYFHLQLLEKLEILKKMPRKYLGKKVKLMKEIAWLKRKTKQFREKM